MAYPGTPQWFQIQAYIDRQASAAAQTAAAEQEEREAQARGRAEGAALFLLTAHASVLL